MVPKASSTPPSPTNPSLPPKLDLCMSECRHAALRLLPSGYNGVDWPDLPSAQTDLVAKPEVKVAPAVVVIYSG